MSDLEQSGSEEEDYSDEEEEEYPSSDVEEKPSKARKPLKVPTEKQPKVREILNITVRSCKLLTKVIL